MANNIRKDFLFNELGILSAIGNTPLVKLDNLFDTAPVSIYAKLEFLNPGGSTKDRPALNIIRAAWQKGLIRHDTTVIESSSGNIGIGLAQICHSMRLKFTCVVDPNITKQNLQILKIYGANIVMVSDSCGNENYLNARIEKVKEIISGDSNTFWCNQYANFDNATSHFSTVQEIADALGNKIDYFFCATSTCGMLRGAYEYCKKVSLQFNLVAVDAVGSVIFGGKPGKRLIPGHGAGRVPELYRPGIESELVCVTDMDSIEGCYRLLHKESIFAGGSSGALVAALGKKLASIPPFSNCVMVLCDRGERYLDTIYSPEWIINNFGYIDSIQKQYGQ